MNPEQPQQQPGQSSPAPQQYTAPDGGNNPGQFTSNEPPKAKKTGLLVAIIVAVVVIIGAVAFAMMNSDKKDGSNKNTTNNSNTNTGSSNPDTSKYQSYDVTDKVTGQKFSVLFYKDAAVEEKNGRTYLNVGETGSMRSVYLGVATGDKIDCGESPKTTMKVAGGESSDVCYMSDNTQYAGYAMSKAGLVKVNLAGQKAISMDEAKAILESVSFN